MQNFTKNEWLKLTAVAVTAAFLNTNILWVVDGGMAGCLRRGSIQDERIMVEERLAMEDRLRQRIPVDMLPIDFNIDEKTAFLLDDKEHLLNAKENVEQMKEFLQKYDKEAVAERLMIAKRLKESIAPDNELKGFIDLHHHTFRSDGQYSPTYVVYQAWKKGLSAVGVVDHNTFAHFEEAVRAGEIFGITVIPGIELDAWEMEGFETDGQRVNTKDTHIIGYFPYGGGIAGRRNTDEFLQWFDGLKETELYGEVQKRILWNGIKQELIRQRLNRSKKAEEDDIEITLEDIVKYGTDVANWAQTALYLTKKYPERFKVMDWNEVKKKYINDNYVPEIADEKANGIRRVNAGKIGRMLDGARDFGMEMRWVLKEIARNGGVAVLPHPIEKRCGNINLSKDEQKNPELIAQTVKQMFQHYASVKAVNGGSVAGFGGIEVYIGKHTKEDIERYEDIVKELNETFYKNSPLIMTISTDAHNIEEEGVRMELGVGKISQEYTQGNLYDLQNEFLKSEYQQRVIEGLMKKARSVIPRHARDILRMTDEEILELVYPGNEEIVKHIENVAAYAEIAAGVLGLDEEGKKILRAAAFAHDVGGVLGNKDEERIESGIFASAKKYEVEFNDRGHDEVITEFEKEGVELTREQIVFMPQMDHPANSVRKLKAAGVDIPYGLEIIIRHHQGMEMAKAVKAINEGDFGAKEKERLLKVLAIFSAGDIFEFGNNYYKHQNPEMDVKRRREFETPQETLDFLKRYFKAIGLPYEFAEQLEPLIKDERFLAVIKRSRMPLEEFISLKKVQTIEKPPVSAQHSI